MKIIHWEYNEEIRGAHGDAIADYSIGPSRNIETNLITGIYFKWRYLLQNGQNVVLHCVCEESIKVDYIKSLLLPELKIIFYKSMLNFKAVFLDRLDLINFHVEPPPFQISEEQFVYALSELKK